MGKILKFCNSCEEGFAEKFTFCPDCGAPLQAYEMKPVDGSAKDKSVVSKPETEENLLEVAPAETASSMPAADPIAAQEIVPAVTEELPPAGSVSAADFETGPLDQPAEALTEERPEVAVALPTEVAEVKEEKQVSEASADEEPIKSVASSTPKEFYTTPEMHADEPRSAAPTRFTKEDDGGFYVTVIQEKNQKQRNVLLLGALGFVLVTFTLAWGVSLFQTDLGVGNIDSDFSLARLIDEVPTTIDLEDVEPPKGNDKDSGGGGGGGRDEDTPTSKGQLAPQNERPIIAPTKTIIQRDNPELVSPTATTQGPERPVVRTDERYGDPNSRFSTLSDGTGSGGGQGSGSGTGQGSGTGTGAGSGTGSGMGSGSGDGIGPGTGRGTTAPTAPSRPAVTTNLRITSRPRADYTAAAREKAIQGTVRLRVTFLSNGQIGTIQTLKGLPEGLTDQAIAAARKMTFEPRMVDGRPVAVSQTVEYNFNLY